MRVPISRMDEVAQGTVTSFSQPYTVYRPSGDGDDSYGEPSSDEYSPHGSTRDLYLFSPRERTSQSVAGEETDADLGGLALPSVDIKEDDRVDHGTVRYEVEIIEEVPDSENPDLLRLSLSRV